MFHFTITHKDGKARTGIIKTSHGEIQTPAFIPLATAGSVKAITPQQLNEIGFDSIMANTYHLYLQPGQKIVQKLSGVQKFIGWNKPMWTDSGGFQVFSLKNCKIDDKGVTFFSHLDNSKHYFTPEKAIRIQQQLGADIIFTFDHCIPHDSDYETAKKAMERTHEWAKRCLKEFTKRKNNGQALYGIIQGGKFKDLRTESTQFISSLGFQGFGLGSLFGEPKEETLTIAKIMMNLLPEEKPKHFLGIGSIDDLFQYVEMGGDSFDCVLPTRLGRVGYVFLTPNGGGKISNKFRIRITNAKFKEDKNPIDKNCKCYVCENFSRAYLRYLFKAKELSFYTLATFHNLYFFYTLMGTMRKAIAEKRFKSLKQEWLQ